MASEIIFASDATMGIQTDIHKPWKWEWRINGDPIPGAQNAPSYTLPSSSSGGSYSCVIYGVRGDFEETPPVVVTRQTLTIQQPVEKQVFPKAVVDAVLEQVREQGGSN